MCTINIIDLISLITTIDHEGLYYLKISTLTYFTGPYRKKFDVNTDLFFRLESHEVRDTSSYVN